jgi:acetylornithine deacetylase/succinyl-diaminopimelate desuccinylase-like protein
MRFRAAATAAACVLAIAATPHAQSDPIAAYVQSHQRDMVTTLINFASMPNTRGDVANLQRNAMFASDLLKTRGFAVELVATSGAPLVIGSLPVAGATRTLLLYAHYDGQPVDPAKWQQASPFVPVLRSGRLDAASVREIAIPETLTQFDPDWRLYARAAADDKAPIVALMTALDGMRASGLAPTWNLKVLLDGEEESGSPGLGAISGAVRDRLKADLTLVLDAPAHPSGRPTLVFGARGNVTFELTVYGAKGELHSGHYGNWAPNPALRLAQLLASMKDASGRVLIKGFYDGISPLTADERALLRAVPDDEPALLRLFGLSAPEASAESLQEAYQRPSLTIRGLASGHVGSAAAGVIPNTAIANFDLRLVTETSSADMLRKVRTHIEAQGFHIVDADPDDATRARYRDIVKLVPSRATEAYRVSVTTPQARGIIAALTKAFGQAPVVLRTSGATVPMADMSVASGAPAILVQTVNFDNNQHTDNENIRLGHLFEAVRTFAALLAAP